jgi:hypothetical protein
MKVVIYTYFSSPSSDYNLAFFVKKELRLRDDMDYIVVINGFFSIRLPALENLTVLRRPNSGYDFGGHACALQHLEKMKKKYDYYFFMNSGVIGPIVRNPEPHWSTLFTQKITNRVKLVGTTIVCLPPQDAGGYGPKVEGFFFLVDAVGLDVLTRQKTIFCQHPDKYSAIVHGEYGLSNCILKHGYSLDCMLPPYQNLDWTDPKNYNLNNNLHPSRKNSFYNQSIDPYDVIFHKWYWHGLETVNFDVVKDYVSKN